MKKNAIVLYSLVIFLGIGWGFERINSSRSLRALISADQQLKELKNKLELKSEISNSIPEPLVVVESPPAISESIPDTESVMVSTVKVGNSEGPPPMTENTINTIDRFDYAMDKEFNRLEKREEKSTDSTEVATINVIKEKLVELDELYIRADQATDAEERIALRKEMQLTMGSIIGLSRQDRNERISKLAADIGYTDPQAVKQFVREIDRVYRETHMDWTKLFNRTPPAMAPTNPENISPGMTVESAPVAE